MLAIFRGTPERLPFTLQDNVTGTLTGHFAISLVVDGGVITLEPAEVRRILPDLQRFEERTRDIDLDS